MFSKALILASSLFLACSAIALPTEAAPAEPEIEARAAATDGGILLYSGTSYSGSRYEVGVVSGANQFCTEWTNINNGQNLYTVKSFIASNIACILYGQSNCAGQATGTFSTVGLRQQMIAYTDRGQGINNNTNTSFKSFFCNFENN